MLRLQHPLSLLEKKTPPCRRLSRPLPWQRSLPRAAAAQPEAKLLWKSLLLPLQKQPQPKPAAEEEVEVPIVIEENAKVKAAVDYLREVIALMGVENVTFSAVQKGEATIIRLDGEKLGALIGRRGETMESLSYLASLVANRLEGDYIKLGLDVAGYRDKRESDLTALAQRIGAKVRKTGRSFAMEPMNPYERRIIHSAIGKMEGVRSESKGEGRDRRVVIYSTAPDARPTTPTASAVPAADAAMAAVPAAAAMAAIAAGTVLSMATTMETAAATVAAAAVHPRPASVQCAGAHLRPPRRRECSTRSTQAHRARGRFLQISASARSSCNTELLFEIRVSGKSADFPETFFTQRILPKTDAKVVSGRAAVAVY